MQVETIVATAIKGRNHERHVLMHEPDVAHQTRIEDGVDGRTGVGTTFRKATHGRAFGRRVHHLRASGGTCARSGAIQSARESWPRSNDVVRARHLAPATLAAATPVTASSITSTRAGSSPRRLHA